MERMRVRDIMTAPVLLVAPDTPVPAAIALMRARRIRHLPVVVNDRLVGIVSRGDLREASLSTGLNANSYELNFMLSRLTIDKLMTRKVFTVTPDAPLVHVAELMTEQKIACLPVVNQDGAVIGIVTESDLLRTLARKLRETEEAAAAPV